MERATGNGELMRLKLAVLPLFASYRLMPRLGEAAGAPPRSPYRHRHRGRTRSPGSTKGSTRRSRWRARSIRSLYSRRLGTNRVVAIGARQLAEGPQALTDPAQLAGATVLLHRDLPDAFDYWREAVGLPDLEPAAIDHFDSGQLILDAAAQGLGVAFMFEMHLEGAHDPRLVRLFDVAVESPYSYWFACRRSALSRRPVRIFHDWLIERAGCRSTATTPGPSPDLQTLIAPMIRRIAARGRKRLAWAPILLARPGITTALLRSRPSRPAPTTLRRVGADPARASGW